MEEQATVQEQQPQEATQAQAPEQPPVVELLVGDAIAWLEERPGVVPAIVANLPDAAEAGPWGKTGDLKAWEDWFRRMVAASFRAVRRGGPVILWVTDRKRERQVISKAHLVHLVADEVGIPCAMHKVGVTRRGASLFRPGFSHLLVYGKDVKQGPATPDAFAAGPGIDRGDMPFLAAKLAVRIALEAGADIIVDPWVGAGTIPVLATALGAKGVVGLCATEPRRQKAAKLTVYDFTKIAKRVPPPEEAPVGGLDPDEPEEPATAAEPQEAVDTGAQPAVG